MAPGARRDSAIHRRIRVTILAVALAIARSVPHFGGLLLMGISLVFLDLHYRFGVVDEINGSGSGFPPVRRLERHLQLPYMFGLIGGGTQHPQYVKIYNALH